MPRKILVLGKTGMLGSMVFHYFSNHSNYLTHGTTRKVNNKGKNILLFDAEKFLEKESDFKFLKDFDYIINCIGIIKPYCQDDDVHGVFRAIKINALFPHKLARFCENSPAKIIQITTDCVYSGKKGQYKESDPHDSLDVYGKTKSLGEVSAKNFLNIRCSIVGPEPYNKVNLLEWFLAQKGKINGFAHHRWNGVTTLQFAKLCHLIIENNQFEEFVKVSPVHHFVLNNSVTKFELLNIFKDVFQKKVEIQKVDNIGPPIDRSLATEFKNLQSLFGTTGMVTWFKELVEYMKDFNL